MSKKLIVILLFVGVLFTQASLKAQAQDQLSELPNAGLTPNSPPYFLEHVAEAIDEFLTFDTGAKARLQAKKALERIARVKAVLAEKEVNPKGLDVAMIVINEERNKNMPSLAVETILMNNRTMLDYLQELGKNSQTGKEIKISAKKVVRFKAGSELASKIK